MAQYDEGLVADPEQPAILTNKAVALKDAALNASTRPLDKNLDDAAKGALLQSAKRFQSVSGSCG